MEILGLDHIGIAVRSLETSLPFFRDVLGLAYEGTEDVPGMRVRVAKLRSGDARLELVEPLAGEETVTRFLARRGEGVHHVCFRVADVARASEELRCRGFRVLYEPPREGSGGAAVNFLHPGETAGVLVELTSGGKDGSGE